MGVPISSLPAASALTGAELFPVVQSGQTKRTTTDAIPYVPAGTGAVATTVQSKLRETVSVFDFMTAAQIADVRSGTASIDVTAAIQAAINSLTAGGIVYLPPGTYKCTSTITVNEGVTLQGSGRRSVGFPPTCRLVFTTNTGASASIQTNNGSDISLKDFYLSGRSSGSGDEIQINGNSRRISIENVTVNTSTTGSAFNIGIGGFCIQSRLVGCLALGAAYGFSVSQSSTSTSLISCYANANTVAGYLLQGTYLALLGCASDANGLYGYVLQNAISVGITGCGAESNVRSALNFVNAGNVTISGFRSVANNTGASSAYPSVAIVDYGSYNITASGVEDSLVNAATVYSVSHLNGNAPSNIEFNGTFTMPFNSTVIANESPRQSIWAVTAFNGTLASPAPIAGRNITAITKNGTGDYTVTFVNPKDVRTIVSTGNAAANGSVAVVVGQVNSTVNTVQVRCYNGSTGALTDSALITLHIFAI